MTRAVVLQTLGDPAGDYARAVAVGLTQDPAVRAHLRGRGLAGEHAPEPGASASDIGSC